MNETFLIIAFMLFGLSVIFGIMLIEREPKKVGKNDRESIVSADYRELDVLCYQLASTDDYLAQSRYSDVIKVKTGVVEEKEKINVKLYEKKKTLEVFNDCCRLAMENPLLMKRIHQLSEYEGVVVLSNIIGLNDRNTQAYALPLKQPVCLLKQEDI